jgi:hypothetical protein
VIQNPAPHRDTSLGGTKGWDSLLFLDVFFEVVQGLAPEHLVIIDPFVDDAQGLGVEATKAGCALLLGDDEAGSVEKSQVLGDGGAAHAEVARDASHGLTAAAEDPEDFTAGRVGDGTEDGFVLPAVLSNHRVTNESNHVVSNCQRMFAITEPVQSK